MRYLREMHPARVIAAIVAAMMIVIAIVLVAIPDDARASVITALLLGFGLIAVVTGLAGLVYANRMFRGW
jgi:protein-S-isoprenylcysteine O-methyltransferase Ste14